MVSYFPDGISRSGISQTTLGGDDECNYWAPLSLTFLFMYLLINFFNFIYQFILVYVFIHYYRLVRFIYLYVCLFTYCSSCLSYFDIYIYFFLPVWVIYFISYSCVTSVHV